MSRQVVGYEKGRPVFKDEGPSRGRVGSADSEMMSSLGAATLPDRLQPTLGAGEGAGQVERRQATEAQRAAWAAEREGKPRSPGTNGDPFAASRARGAARAGFVPGATKPYLEKRVPVTPSPPEEVPVSIALAPIPTLLMPCEDCAHAPVCSIRPALEADVAIDLAAVVLPTGTRVTGVTIECAFYLAGVERRAPQDAPESVTPARAPDDTTTTPVVAGRPGRNGTAKLPADRDEREAKVLAAVRASPTTSKAAILLDCSAARVQQIIQEMRREGRLPADVDELMRKRAGGRPGWAQA